jgi:hypothetical protein
MLVCMCGLCAFACTYVHIPCACLCEGHMEPVLVWMMELHCFCEITWWPILGINNARPPLVDALPIAPDNSHTTPQEAFLDLNPQGPRSLGYQTTPPAPTYLQGSPRLCLGSLSHSPTLTQMLPLALCPSAHMVDRFMSQGQDKDLLFLSYIVGRRSWLPQGFSTQKGGVQAWQGLGLPPHHNCQCRAAIDSPQAYCGGCNYSSRCVPPRG